MKERTRKIFIMIVMAALIVSLTAASFAALTYGRYTGGKLDDDSPYDEIIDFVGATAYEVTSPDAFINAINNGYSYIKIADDAEEPFVINNNIANVYTNLVIDVNGNTVIRNSRNPVLDVQRNISVVLVYDSSTEQAGGFYNPVGSALQTSGGSLTVGSGSYESGPKIASVPSVTEEEIEDVFVRDGARDSATAYYKKADSAVSLPKLTKDVYLENDVTEGYLRNDTYLLYTQESNCYVDVDGKLYVDCETEGTDTGTGESGTVTGTEFSVECNVASCDFYYYYPVNGTAGTADSPQTYAVVYGYNDVKKLAETKDTTLTSGNDTNLVWPYAAIRSVEDEDTQEGGVTHARGGAFTTNFGTDNTYGILSVGGEMTVGTESATAPPTFTAVGEGTCIGMSAQTGDTLTIASGSFSSQVGDTILMRGGEMTVTGGTFTKSGNKARPSGGLEAIEASRTALIHMLGGELTIDGTVTGESDSRTYSVNMTAGSTDAPLTNVFGIYSTETTDETTGKAVEGTVTISGCKITVNGTYSAGVLSSAGTVNLGGTAAGKAETNITVNNSISNNLLTSSAVSSEGGTINLNNTVEIKSDSLGITARGTINVGDETTQAAANVTVNTENATGVYVNNGTLNVNAGATLGVTSTVRSNTKWVQPPEGQTEIPPSIYNGVYVNGGSLNSTGTLNVTFTGVENESHKSYDALKIRSYAVRVEAAATGDDTEVKITAGTIINQVQYDEQGKEIAGGGGGVYVGGGKVTLGISGEGGPTIGTTGVSFGDENTSAGGGNWKYYENKTGGHAVEVDAGELLVYNGLYTAKLGNGILVRGGNAWVLNGTFQGNDTETYRAKYGVGNLPAGPAAYYALKLLGGSVTTFGGTFGTDDTHTAEGSSAFVTGVDDQQAKANIYGGTFKVDGQAGFSVYQNVALTFTPKETVTVGEGQNLTGSDVTVSAATTAIAIENTTNKNVSVTINGGTFQSMLDDSGQRDGIWDSNPYAKLTINEGEKQKTTISALAKHGINLVYAPAIENRVTITGGTITGKQDGIYYGSNGTAANGLLISGGTITGSNGSGLNLAGAPAASGAVTITGGTIEGKQDGIHYGSNGTAANGLLISGGTITGSNGSGLNLAGAPAASGAVTITGGTITGSNHGVYYGARGAVNDGLLIEDGTITGTNGAGLYFAANPWQNNGGVTNNVAIVGGTFVGNSTSREDWSRDYWVNGAIGADSDGFNSGLGHEIQITDIIECDSGKSIYYYEDSTSSDANNVVPLQNYKGADRNDQKINQTTCRYDKVVIQ